MKERSKSKYRSNLEYQKNVIERNKRKFKSNANFQEAAKKARRNKYISDKLFQEKCRTLNRLRYRKNVLIREQYKRKLREQYNHDEMVRRKKILLSQSRRLIDNQNGIASWFREEVRNGPKYVCTVCHKFKFRKQVIVCDLNEYSNGAVDLLYMSSTYIKR